MPTTKSSLQNQSMGVSSDFSPCLNLPPTQVNEVCSPFDFKDVCRDAAEPALDPARHVGENKEIYNFSSVTSTKVTVGHVVLPLAARCSRKILQSSV